MSLDQICDISGPTFCCEIYVFFQVSFNQAIWVFSLKHKRVCRPIDIVWRVYCLSRAMEGTWSDFIRLSPPMLLLATIHDGHKTSTCFPPVCLSLSLLRQVNQLSKPVPTSKPLSWIVMQLAEKFQQNCEIRWGRLDRLRSKHLSESALAAPFQPASVSGSGDQAAGEKPTSYLITSPTNHKTK